MGGFNVSHGLFISASFADGMIERLWELTVAFFISPVKLNGGEREVVCTARIQIGLTIQ
jgi:hypothetical protein